MNRKSILLLPLFAGLFLAGCPAPEPVPLTDGQKKEIISDGAILGSFFGGPVGTAIGGLATAGLLGIAGVAHLTVRKRVAALEDSADETTDPVPAPPVPQTITVHPGANLTINPPGVPKP